MNFTGYIASYGSTGSAVVFCVSLWGGTGESGAHTSGYRVNVVEEGTASFFTKDDLTFAIREVEIWFVGKRVPMEAVPLKLATVANVEDKRRAFKHQSLYMFVKRSDLQLYSLVNFNRAVSSSENDSFVALDDKVVVLKVANSGKIKRAAGIN